MNTIIAAAQPHLKTKLARILKIKRYFSSVVTDEQIERFRRDGVVCLRGIFDKKWINVVNEGVSKNLKEPSKYCDWLVNEDGSGLFFNDYFNFNRFKEFHDYIHFSPAAEIAGRLMQSKKSIFFHEHVFFKESGSSKETPWHHDITYYPIDGMQNCSVWMPTTHVRKEANVKYVRGSHKWSRCFLPVLFKNHENYELADPELTDATDISEYMKEVKKEDILQWEMEPGDCIVFHMRMVHGTEKSTAKDNRTAIATRWLGDDSTFIERPWKTSPPMELLPDVLEVGCKIAAKENFIVPWTE